MRNLLFSLLLYSITITSQNSILKNYSSSNGLFSTNINSLTQDTIGYLWLASSDKGLFSFDGHQFVNFTKNDGLISNKIHHLLFSSDSLFVASDKGLSIKTYHKFINISGEEILKIRKINNQIILATKQGISIYIDGKIVPLKLNYQIDLSPINDIQYFNNGYYIATYKTLWFVNSLTNPTKTIRINEGNFSSLKLLNKQLFATTRNKGVQVFEANKNQMRFKDIKHITSINFSSNQYWISTDNNGVYVYNADYNFEKKISKYNGLKVNHISEVFIDRVHNYWLGTIGNGLYKFTPETTLNNRKNSNIYFENIEVDYQTIDSIPINHYEKILYLKPRHNNISFSFKTIDINAPTKLEYRWKLNDDESPWRVKNNIAFANLKPGSYTFQVQSRNSTLNESSYIKFLFFIDTPIYKKEWFIYSISGVIICILLLTFILIFNSIQKKNTRKLKHLTLQNHLLSLEQKALQLQMNPHFIFNVLNGIKALGSQGKSEEMNDTINNFASLLRGVLHNSRKEEISLQQEIDTIKRFVILEQQMSSKIFYFSVDTSNIKIDLDEILIPPMLIQPFIENAIKHGIRAKDTNGNIVLSFYIKNTFLNCTITDNGIGYKQSKKEASNANHQSVAIEVTRERIKSISGEQSFYISEVIENKEVKGTKVWFKIPLKTEF